MTTAQLNAMRTLAENMSRNEKTMTAREMALSSHNLDRTGDKATLKTGEVYYWSENRELWIG